MTEKFGNAFSEKFSIPADWLSKKGVFDPTLDVDSPLFVDPFLLFYSKHKEFSGCAHDTYEQHFTEIYKLLRASQVIGDKAWAGALRKFRFSETKGLGGTCLGYSKTTKGRGFGPILSARALKWAGDVIRLGVNDPELFSCMSLFEGGIGADLISDMVTNIALKCIIDFNERIYAELESEMGIRLTRGEVKLREFTPSLPLNPYTNDGTPIILLPADILKHLPIANDARQIIHVASANGDLRDRVNAHISEIFKITTKKDKDATKEKAMKDAAAFQTLLDLLKIMEKQPYDLLKDPEGLIQWRAISQYVSATYQLKISDDPKASRPERIDNVVEAVIKQFSSLVEDNRLWRVFYVDQEPRHERFAQLLFFSVAKSYCLANDLDISPEADAGVGPVDFKFSDGGDSVLVEIKLSTNSNVVRGYEKQLEAYLSAEDTRKGHYVVIDVGRMGNKWEGLRSLMNSNLDAAKRKPVHLIDGTWRESASKQ